MAQLQIDEVYPKEKLYPLVINFQNAYLNDNFSEQKCLLLENNETSKKNVVTEICDLVYSGEENEEKLGKTLLLVRNKNTGKVRLLETGSIDMKPYIKTDLEAVQLQETSYLELSRKFGSKKHKKVVEQREKLKVNVETVTEQMQNISQNITEDQLDLSTYNKTDEDSYIPPINREATEASGVYDIDAILPEELYDKVYEEIENSDYLNGLIPMIKAMTTKKLTNKQTVLAVYANSLLNLYSTLMRDIVKKNFVACQYSATLNEIILKNFLGISNLKRIRTPQMKDKSLCHAMVFLLLINNLRFDVEELCQQLKLTMRTVITKIQVTGASIVSLSSKKVAQLKLPLNKPAIRRKSAKF
ncbi:hypothetical protein O3G_MSEX012350 [Manduca sexta]|uniref:DNA-directed RNA polymerase I subunit RPA49 n=1 Tax=Manduca sexta TaxID=7130 RepID=A0A922CWI4_MANSE|nr:hypothetical protein O3G_MSEX012350 [Manduca sexta]